MSCSLCGTTHERARFCRSRPGRSRLGTTPRSAAQSEIVAPEEAARSSLAGIRRMYDRAMARDGIQAQASLRGYLAEPAATS